MPRRKVPVVSTTRPARSASPPASCTPPTRCAPPPADDDFSTIRSSTEPSWMVRPSTPSTAASAASRYRSRSACARGPCTAGPFRRLSIRKWMPARSISPPISPSSASTSRTRCPLPIPPIDGLHDISPIVSTRCVTRIVRAPARAAAAAASQPACPPPTTITSASDADAAILEARAGAARCTARCGAGARGACGL